MTFVLKIFIDDEVEIIEEVNLGQAIRLAEGRAGRLACDTPIGPHGILHWYFRNQELVASIAGPILFTIERKA